MTQKQDLIPHASARDVMRFCIHYWRQDWKRGALSFGLLAISVGVDIFYPVLSGRLVDRLSHLDPALEGSLTAVLWAFAALVGVNITHSWTWNGSFWIFNGFAARILQKLLIDATAKVQRFSLDWHVNSFAGGTVRKITRGMWSFDAFEDTIFMGIFPATIIGIGMVVMLLVKLPLVGLFAAFMVTLFVLASIFLAVKVAMPNFRESAEQDTLVGATLADLMTGITTVKSFAGEKREDATFERVTSSWHDKFLRAWRTQTVIDVIRSHIRILLMTGMLGLVIYLWYGEKASAGDMTLAITAFFIIGGYLRDIGRHVTELLRTVSEMTDIVGFWMRDDDVQDANDARPLRITQEKSKGAEIAFDNVGFKYNQGGRPIYNGLTVTIRAGEKVALVGASGSGKSTFVKLIQRLYDIQSGEIRIEGQNIAHVTQESLRQTIALVPQDPVLFHRSLAENIAYGRTGATIEEIRAAARESYAAGFIESLPDGYKTLVGERGIKLSGGERQRVAIARALLADCPILILDEATSSLDSVSEHYIQKALERLMEGRTTITIAHRLATIRKADRILVFDNGCIVEEGRHSDLLSNPESVYKKLHDIQAFDLVDAQ